MVIGMIQTLTVEEVVNGGFRVGDGDDSALLPTRNVKGELNIGDSIRVFIYTDKEGEPLATMSMPFAERGQFALLEVIDISRHGLHLDWGLERDLFVPFDLQHERLSVGDRAVFRVDVDLQGRLFASNRLIEFFDPNLDGLDNDQEVSLLVFGFNHFGALVVVDNRYTGIIYSNETYQQIRLGDELTGYIKCLRHDGKIDVTLQRTRRAGTEDAVDTVLDALNAKGGFLPLTDKSDPDRIRHELKMSKKVFKKALGSLYRQRRILLEPDGVRMTSSEADSEPADSDG